MSTAESHWDEDHFAQRLAELDQALTLTAGQGETTPCDGAVPPNDDLEMAHKVLKLIRRVKTRSQESGELSTSDLHFATPLPQVSTRSVTAAPGDVPDEVPGDNPRRIGRFVIRRPLGQGGYGVVFLARDPQLQRDVAVKVPRPEVILTSSLRERFLREARAAALLSHPNIVPVFEAGEGGVVCYIATQFVEGPTLAEWLHNEGDTRRPGCREAAAVLTVLAEAIQHAHQRGVLHRDLKPSNILLGRAAADDNGHPSERADDVVPDFATLADVTPLVTDFGMARLVEESAELTRSGTILGTPAYMSPEQTRCGASDMDERTDVYGLGVILYELLTGQPPFRANTAMETMRLVQSAEPQRPRQFNAAVPRDLEAICLKCIEKEPADRYPSAWALQSDLQRFLDGQPVVASPVTWDRRLMKWIQRNPRLAGSIGAAVLTTIAGFAVITGLWLRADRLRLEAETSNQRAVAKSAQLTQAVDDLLTAIAEAPEVKLNGFEQLRLDLLERAHQFYVAFLQEAPATPELQAEHQQTLLRLAKVRAELGDRTGCLELVHSIRREVAAVEQPTAGQRWLLVDLLLLEAGQHEALSQREAAERCMSEVETLARLEFARSTEPGVADADRVELANVLQRLAELNISLGERTQGNHLILESAELWSSIDPDSELQEADLISKGRCLCTAAQALAASEDKRRAIPFADNAIDWLEMLRARKSRQPPTVLYNLARAYQIRGFLHDRDFSPAQAAFEKGRAMSTQLIARHPLVSSYQRLEQAMAYSQALGYFLANRSSEDLEEAFRRFDLNADECRELRTRFPEDKVFSRIYGDNLTMIGLTLGRLGRHDEQLAVLYESRRLVGEMYEQSGGQSSWAIRLAGLNGDIGSCQVAQRDYGAALASLKEAEQQLLEILLTDPENGQARRYLSNTCADMATAYDEMEQYADAVREQKRSMEDFGDPGTMVVKLGDLAVYEAGALDFGRAQRDLAEFIRLSLNEFQAGAPGSNSDPASAALTAARFLRKLDAVRDSVSAEAAWGEAFDAAAELGISCLECIRATAGQSQTSLDDVLRNPQLAPLRSTTHYVDWAARNRIPLPDPVP